MTIRELLDKTVAKLVDFGKEERAAYELLKDIEKFESYELYEKLDETVQEDVVETFEMAIDHYIKGIPLQHILGYETFFGRDFIVNDQVLIPRYETEELVENILYHIDDYFAEYEQITIADIGTGSGAIAITLDLEEDKAKVYATDISQEAIDVAADNCTKFDSDVQLYQGDLVQPLVYIGAKVDIFVSNPPYIPNEELVDSSVKDNEPNIALFGGKEGLDFYRRLFVDAKEILNEKALLAFEIGHKQKDALIEEVKIHYPNCDYEVLKDINGKNRMLFIYKGFKK